MAPGPGVFDGKGLHVAALPTGTLTMFTPLSRFKPVTMAAGLSLAGLCTLLAAAPAQASVGAQVLLQTWNPQQPQTQGLLAPARSPTIVSDTLAVFWAGAGRAAACAAVNEALAGFRPQLTAIDCQLNASADLQALPGANGQIVLRLSVPTNKVFASAEIDLVPDPRFSVDFDLQLDLTLAATSDPHRLLRVTKADVHVANAHIDSQNFIGDVLEAANLLVSFIGGPDFMRQAERALEKPAINIVQRANDALPPVNAQLKLPAMMVGSHVRVGLWSRPGMLTVAFAPAPVPVGGGAMEGTVRWDPATVELPRCDDLAIAATVQVGPRPLLSPDGALGTAPLRTVGTLRPLQVANGSCRYRLDGLGLGLPHRLEASAQGAARPVQARAGHMSVIPMQPQGWSGEAVTPQPVAAPRDYLISATQLLAPKRALPAMPNGTVKLQPGVSDGPFDPPGSRVGAGTGRPWATTGVGATATRPIATQPLPGAAGTGVRLP